MKPIKCDVVLLVPGNTYTGNFVVSWSKTLLYLKNSNKKFFFNMFYMPIITSVRNHLIASKFVNRQIPNFSNWSTIPFEGTVIPKKVIFIDSDMVWEPTVIQQLLDSPYDITVAPYVLSDRKTSSVAIEQEFISIDELNKYEKPFTISKSGLGMVAIKFDVLKQIPYPWFMVSEGVNTYEDGRQEAFTQGEDVYFFNKIKEYGFEIYCDPRIKVGHEKLMILTP